MVASVTCCCDQTSGGEKEKKNLILAHSLRSSHLSLWGAMRDSSSALGDTSPPYIAADRKLEANTVIAVYKPQVLPPVIHCIQLDLTLLGSQTPRTALPSVDQVFRREPVKDISHSDSCRLLLLLAYHCINNGSCKPGGGVVSI